MLSDLLWVFIIGLFVLFGFSRPFIALSGVLFVDILRPQDLSFNFLANKPIALFVTLFFFMSLIINWKKWNIPSFKTHPILLVSFIVWITLTTMQAEFPASAWYKHDYAYKTILFALFVPFVLKEKAQYEFAISIIIFAAAFYFITAGMTTVFETTYYGRRLIHTRVGDTMMTESSTLAMTAVMILPLIYFLIKEISFAKKIPFLKTLMWLTCFAALMTIIGSHARTGVVGLGILGLIVIYKSKHKLKLSLAVLIIGIFSLSFASSSWKDRMLTITESQTESSALGRIVVWRWTLDYVADRPVFGGGFMSYQANAGQLREFNDDGPEIDYKESSGKAFHNIYIEVLGEHGYVGLFIFLLILYHTWNQNNFVYKNSSSDWFKLAAKSNNISLLVFCSCGMFIGVAFSPWAYLFFGFATALKQIHLKEQKEAQIA